MVTAAQLAPPLRVITRRPVELVSDTSMATPWVGVVKPRWEMLVLPLPVKTVAQLPPPLNVATISPPHPAAATEVVGLARAGMPWQAVGSAAASAVKAPPAF